MIGLDELKRRAAEAQVTLETIEIDYVLAWVLWGFFQNELLKDNLVFKGGTALRKIYFPNYTEYRYSEDLDFTAKTELPEDDLRETIDSSCTLVRDTSNIDLRLGGLRSYEFSISKAYKGRLYFIGPRKPPSPRRLNLDIDCSEEIVLSPNLLSPEHPYSDADDCNVLVPTYPLEEILAEKLRTLLTRPWARHFYDVWYLLGNHADEIDLNQAREIFHRKREYKGVPFSGVSAFLDASRLATAKGGWNASLRNVMRDIPPFDKVVNELRISLASLFGQRTRNISP